MNRVFSRWADDQDVRAVLFPLSDAARYSTELPQNKAQIENIRERLTNPRLPSPVEPDEDFGASHKASVKALAGQAIRPVENVVILRQNKNLHRFTLGSDLGNFFALESDPVSKDDVCYINLSHCQFYLSPESSEIWLQNSSTSKHSVQDWSLQSRPYDISSGHSVPLHPGTWTLNLGEGLHFILYVNPSEDVRNPRMYTVSKMLVVNKKKSMAGSRTALARSSGKSAAVDGQKSARKNDMPPQEPPGKTSR